MENKIIDVEFREVTDLEELSTEMLTEQANTIYAQAETVAAVSLHLVAEAGKRLLIIKERVGHGGWEDWKKSKLSFSSRKAERMMKLATKMEDDGSIFSNPSALTDIGISKVWALLSAPEEVAEEVIENPGASEMTLKELQAEIHKSKLEAQALRGASEHDKKEIERLTQIKDQLKKQLREREKEAIETPDTSELEAEKDELQEKLKEAKAELRDYKKQVKTQMDAERAAAEQEAQKKAEAEAEKKIEEQAERIRKEEADKRAGLEKEIEKLNKMADPVTLEFKVRAEALQEDFAACRQTIEQAEPERREKMKEALKVVLQKMEERI